MNVKEKDRISEKQQKNNRQRAIPEKKENKEKISRKAHNQSQQETAQ